MVSHYSTTSQPTHTSGHPHTTRICIQFTFRRVLSPAQLLTVCQTKACPWVKSIFCRLDRHYPLYLPLPPFFFYLPPPSLYFCAYPAFIFTVSLISRCLGSRLLSLLALHRSYDWDGFFFFFLHLTSHCPAMSTLPQAD